MAKFELKFIDALDDERYITCDKLEDPDTREEFISITTLEDEFNVIWLDKSTAIKFAKTLRTEINKIKEVNNAK